jgi:O-antigen/teichoic acid export membrane protein
MLKTDQSSQLKIGVILSYVSTILNIIVQLVYTPLMIRLLGQSEYGVYTLVGSVVSYLSLFSLGFTAAYLRFYSRYKVQDDKEGVARLNGLFLIVFTIMAVLALVCGLILASYPRQVFGNKLTESELGLAQKLMIVLVFNIALTFPSGLFESIVSAHEKFLFQRLLQLVGTIFNPLLCLPLLLMGYGSLAVVVVITVITVAKLLTSVYFCLKKLNARFAFDQFDFSLLREIASFSFFIFLNMIIDQVNWSVGKFILGRVTGSIAVAIYGVGANINTLYLNFSTSISSVFSPRINRIAAANEPDMLRRFTLLMTKVGRVQFMVLVLIASGFTIFGQDFITKIYATPDYAEAYYVALLLILPVTIPLIQNTALEIQRSLNKHQFRSVVYMVMAVLNALISVPLAKHYGPTGTAIGTAISLILGNGIIMNFHYQKGIGLDMVYFWKSIFNLAKGLVLPVLLGAFIMRNITFERLSVYFAAILGYVAVYCVSMYVFGMNDEERVMVRRPIKKILHSFRGGRT